MRQKKFSITQKRYFPSPCVFCQQIHQGSKVLCNRCMAFLQPIGFACDYCALPLPDENGGLCGFCIKKKPAFDKVFTAYLFEEPLRHLIHEFKYQEGLYLAHFLTELILKALPEAASQTECLVPVPLHPRRLRERGFNQAAELAKLLSRQLGIPFANTLCQKTANTASQARLNRKERALNIQQAFSCKPGKYQHITLIDDLLTTGSTAEAIARSLKKQGVTQVDVWCCARAVQKK
ncbi:MAG: ComF family protein [Tatlockia sp.]|jgi:ComF family protein